MKIDPELRELGAHLRRLRVDAGLSQEELAERAGLHRNYVGGIERGERNAGIKTFMAISRALARPLRDLIPE